MLRKVSENSGVFVLVGAANASPISVIGVLTLFFEDWPQKTSEIVTTAATLTTVSAAEVLLSLRMPRSLFAPGRRKRASQLKTVCAVQRFQGVYPEKTKKRKIKRHYLVLIVCPATECTIFG